MVSKFDNKKLFLKVQFLNLKKLNYFTSIIVGSPKSGGVGAFSRIVNGSGVGGHGAVCLKIKNKKI